MAMTEAERKAEESFLFGADSGAHQPPPSSDADTLNGAMNVTPTARQKDAAVLAEKRRGQDADRIRYGDDPAGIHDLVGWGEGEKEEEVVPVEPTEGSLTPMPIENKAFGFLTDDDLAALAIANVFPKALEYDEDIDAGATPFGADTWYEDRYPTEGSAAERLAFLMKRRDSKREGVRVAKQFEFIGEAAKGWARWSPWISGIPGAVPGAVVGPPYEAGREYIPKAWEKVQAFKDRLDSLEDTEARLAKSEEEQAKSQAEIKELRERLDRLMDTAELPAE